jgi:hypothetical protein
MNADIRFRVNPKLRARAEKVLKAINSGKANPNTMSDFGRESFHAWLIKTEQELGITNPAPK